MDLDTVITTYLDNLAARNRFPGESLIRAPKRDAVTQSARGRELSDRYLSLS
jgi:hypothetical protein